MGAGSAGSTIMTRIPGSVNRTVTALTAPAALLWALRRGGTLPSALLDPEAEDAVEALHDHRYRGRGRPLRPRPAARDRQGEGDRRDPPPVRRRRPPERPREPAPDELVRPWR